MLYLFEFFIEERIPKGIKARIDEYYLLSKNGKMVIINHK